MFYGSEVVLQNTEESQAILDNNSDPKITADHQCMVKSFRLEKTARYNNRILPN